jgi:hypothetical protein
MLIARVVMVAAVLGGCVRKQSAIEPGSPYEGPAIAIISNGPRHTAVLSAPSSGYGVRLDRTEKRFEATEVYMTVTRPDQALMQAQAVVLLNLDTTVPSEERITLFARLRDFGTSGAGEPYRRVSGQTTR